MVKISFVQCIEKWLNVIEILGIVTVLAIAFVFQFILLELPCPLCLLQRLGFLGICYGFLLNLRYGLRPSHYGLALLSALFTAFVSLRQIALHVIPNSEPYGSAFLGLHMYTWSFIISMSIVLFTVMMFSIDIQYKKIDKNKVRFKYLTYLLFAIVAIMGIVNIGSAYFECGLGQCSDNPVYYLH